MKSIYELKLHEITTLKTETHADIEIMRVPDGWIYDNIFVQYSDEFNQKKKPKRKTSKSKHGPNGTSEKVFNAMKGIRSGLSFREIKNATKLDDKAIRNVLFRYEKTGKIKHIQRGIYVLNDH